MKKINCALILLLVSLVISPRPAFAETVTTGLSPSGFDMVVYRGDVLTETITVMRSTTAGELSIPVSVSGGDASILDVHEQESVVIPDGSNSVEFSFDIDARDAAVGAYNEGVTFLFDSLNTEVGGQVLKMAATSKVRVSVQDRPVSTTVLSVEDYPTLPDDVSFSDLTVTQSPIENGTRLHLAWNAKSTGPNPLRGAEVEIGLYHGKNKANGVTQYVVEEMPTNGFAAQSFDVDLMEPRLSGRYVAEISYQGKTLREGAWVLQPSLRGKLEKLLVAVVLVGAALSFLVVRAGGRKTKSRRGSRR